MARIEKADAAERLIVAAIDIVERGAEPLAAHLLATSALNVLRDLINQADREYITEVAKRGMFLLAELVAQDKPIPFDIPEWVKEQVVELAADIQRGDVASHEELVFNHEKPWQLLDYLVAPTNFLKHADKDPQATLDEADIDPDGAIAHALTAYSLVKPGKPLPDETEAYLRRHDMI